MKSQMENCWGANSSISRTVSYMEDKLLEYFKKADGLANVNDKARFVLELCLQEHDQIIIPSINTRKAHDLEEALDYFFLRKECRYVEDLMQHFIKFGNFDLPGDRIDTVHRLDRFLGIKETLALLFKVPLEQPS